MDLLFPLLILLGLIFLTLKSQQQKQRIALLGKHLSRFDIEALMEGLFAGYARALGEAEPERQAQVWVHLNPQEEKLAQQFEQFAKAFHDVWADDALISTLPMAFPWAHKLFPAATFDARHAMRVHAQGIAQAVSLQADVKKRAFALMAEMMLMQHTCHWFCRSKTVASARLLARHKTRYAQVLDSVLPETRKAYLALVSR